MFFEMDGFTEKATCNKVDSEVKALLFKLRR